MGNEINNIDDVGSLIAKAAAGMFSDKCQFVKSVDKEEDMTKQVNGYNLGDTINVSKPARFPTTTGADVTSSIQDVNEEKVALTLDTQRNVAVALTSAEIAHDLAFKSWSKRILEPAVNNLVMETEADLLEKAIDGVHGSIGTVGSSNFDTDFVLNAGELLDDSLAPMDDQRKALLSPSANRKAVNARKGLFQHSDEIGKQYKKGYMGTADGFDFLKSTLLPTHTNGNDDVFEVRTTVSTEGQETLVVEGLTTSSGTVTKGTTFTIATVNAVHPITGEDLGYLQEFVVTEDETADSNGYATLNISPAIYTTGSKKNVTAFPADGDAITIRGSASDASRQNLFYHPSFFRVAFAPLIKPDGTHLAGQETKDGVTIRVIADYAITTDKMILRLDLLYGGAVVRPEWAKRGFE